MISEDSTLSDDEIDKEQLKQEILDEVAQRMRTRVIRKIREEEIEPEDLVNRAG